MRLDAMRLLLVGGATLWLVACGRTPEEARTTSAAGRILPKSGEVWSRDLADGLDLHTWELCRELGEVDCVTEAHLITLGGVEPTRLGIDEPLAEPSISAPIAFDRVAMAACAERYTRDVAGPAVVFGSVIDKDGTRARREVTTRLVQRLLGRNPTRDETDALLALGPELEAISSDPVRDWSIGACVIVATSLEALFY
ncbi:MAG: hypothetical protein AAGA48_27955 [Myxococcota bacterium]